MCKSLCVLNIILMVAWLSDSVLVLINIVTLIAKSGLYFGWMNICGLVDNLGM